MVGLAFASVPLYRMFCQVTGFGGTTAARRAAAPGAVAGQDRRSGSTPTSIPACRGGSSRCSERSAIAPGARNIAVFYRASNLVARPTTGQAIFNVTPDQAGQYFNKIQCFCFTEQTLKPGRRRDMPVVFFVDPKILKDPDTRDISEITLSYTFYPVETQGSGG